MLTFNHGPYVEQAMVSVLTQSLPDNLEVKLIVGDDASQDGTGQTVERIGKDNPVVVPVLRAANIGPFANYADLWRRADGDYIALLEGDDYWTEPDKLQRQIAAMDSHPEWSMSFHSVAWVDESGRDLHTVAPSPRYLRDGVNATSLAVHNVIPTPSVVYRSGVVGELPEWFSPFTLLDWPVHLLHACAGEVGYLDMIAAAYRVHPGGVWSPKSAVARQSAVLEMAKAFLDHRDTSELSAIAPRLHSEAQHALAIELDRIGERRSARHFFIASLGDAPFSGRRLYRRLRTTARLFGPRRITRRWIHDEPEM